MESQEPLLTASDVARRLGVSSTAVRFMARRGDLAVAVTTERGVRLFRLADVEALYTWRATRVARRARAQS